MFHDGNLPTPTDSIWVLFETVYDTLLEQKENLWVYEILANCVIEWKYSYEQKCCDLWLCLNEVNTGGCDVFVEVTVSVFQFQYSNKPKEKHCV